MIMIVLRMMIITISNFSSGMKKGEGEGLRRSYISVTNVNTIKHNEETVNTRKQQQ